MAGATDPLCRDDAWCCLRLFYPRVLKFTRDSSGEEYFYIRVDVDAMGDTHQSAKIVMDWDNAQKATLPDGVYEVSILS